MWYQLTVHDLIARRYEEIQEEATLAFSTYILTCPDKQTTLTRLLQVNECVLRCVDATKLEPNALYKYVFEL